MNTLKILLLFTLVLLFSCKTAPVEPPYKIEKQLITENAMVVTAHPLASDVGVQILKDGGNAVDAAIAVNFALAVVYPRAGNIGGGGFMIVRTKNGESTALDFREKAPKSASRDMYLDKEGNVVEGLSRSGALAVGVPGAVDGMVKAHQKFGKLPWKQLVEPSILLARDGYLLTQPEAETLNKFQEEFKKYNRHKTVFQQQTWKIRDKIVQSELATTLELIRDNKEAGFYEGPVADKLVAEVQAGKGIITKEDLKAYEAVWRKPIYFNYDNYRLISMPPPSSGGIALAQMLAMLEPYPLDKYGFQSTKSVHLITEAERRAYADRAEHLGDSDFYKVPRNQLIDEQYLLQRMKSFDPAKASVSESVEAGKMLAESEETTHFSIVDKEGNAVSLTTTLNSNFGSKTVVQGAGFFLNNEMDDFSAKPGVPNLYGLVGNEANAIAPEKRMLSSMTPTIIEKDKELFLVVGTPGGSTIITSVLQVFLNLVEYDLGLKEAVHNKRFHHQWLPDQLFIEKGSLSEKVVGELEKMGHQVKERGSIGRVEAILKSNNKLEGVADNRGDDDASGY